MQALLKEVWKSNFRQYGQMKESEKKKEERRSEQKKSQKKEDEGARNGRKVANRCVFPRFWDPARSKSRLAKAAGGELSGQIRHKNCTPLWREDFEVKMHKRRDVKFCTS